MSAETIKQANLAGRQASPGDRNPYYSAGGAESRAWTLGYKTMLLAMLRAKQGTSAS